MKAKKVAILLVSTSLAMGTLGAMTVFADPPATGSEMPGGNAPQMQDRQDFNGEMPQAPSGEAPQAPGRDFSGAKPQASGGQTPQVSNGEAPQTSDDEVPQAPDGQTPSEQNIVKITAIEDGNATVEIRNMTGKPDEATSSEEPSDAETKNYDFSSAEIVKESNGKKESASLSDITTDSMVELELNEDGSVKTVIIKEKPEGHAPDGQKPEGQQSTNNTSA